MAKALTTATPPLSVRFGKGDRSMLQVLHARARSSRRTLSDQMKYFAFIGIAASDNPDLPLEFIQGVLEGLEESRAGLSMPYDWGVLKS